MTVPLVAVAHGSRDPRSAATVVRLIDVVRSRRPDLDVRMAFLDLSAPRLSDVLRAVHGEGHHKVVVVPLLLGNAYHARTDIPGTVAEVHRRHPGLRIQISGVLGPDPRLEAAALRRLAEAGVPADDPEYGVLLAAIGSSHPSANRAVDAIAHRWSARWAGASAAFATAVSPDVPAAAAMLHARGARQIAVSSWFLAPGLLPDRVAAAARALDPGAPIAAPLGADPHVAAVVLDRYTEAVANINWQRSA